MLKALVFQLLESASLSSHWFQIESTLHPLQLGVGEAAAAAAAEGGEEGSPVYHLQPVRRAHSADGSFT